MAEDRGGAADVIVIGGGPAGSAAALRLARQNLHVIQLERRVLLSPGCDRFRSGEGLLPRTRRQLADLGVESDGEPWALSRIRRLRMRWPDGSWTLDSVARNGGLVQIDRERFDHALFYAARAAGVDGREGWHATQLLRDPRGAVAGVLAQPPDRRPPQALRARVVVDAGGRGALSLREPGLRVPEREGDFFAISMFFDQVADLPDDLWEMEMFDPQRLTVVQLSRLCAGVVRCGMGSAGESWRGARRAAQDFFWERAAQSPELARRLAVGRVVLRPFVRASIGYRVRRTTFDGLVLVGDAAGYLNPLFGDGILRALTMAKWAARVVGAGLRRGDCSRAAFARYALWRAATDRLDWVMKAMLLRMQRHPEMIRRFGQSGPLRRALLGALMRS